MEEGQGSAAPPQAGAPAQPSRPVITVWLRAWGAWDPTLGELWGPLQG